MTIAPARITKAGGGDTAAGSVEGTHRSAWERAGLAAVVAFAAGCVAVATRRGPGLTDDSVTYLSSGVNLASGRGVTNLAGQPLTLFPPGLPAIVGAGVKLGMRPQTVARLGSILCICAIVLLAYALLRGVTQRRSVLLGATALVAFSEVAFTVSVMAWTEPYFIVVSLAVVLILAQVYERKTWRWTTAALLVVLCWAGFLLRYVGVSLLIASLAVLMASSRRRDRKALLRVAAFGVASAAVPIAWLLRNNLRDGTYTGNHLPSPESIGSVLHEAALTIGSWVLPFSSASDGLLTAVGIGVFVAVLLTFVAVAIASTGRTKATLVACGVFLSIYLVTVIVSCLRAAVDPLNTRYLSPLLVPGIVVLTSGVDLLLARSENRALRFSSRSRRGRVFDIDRHARFPRGSRRARHDSQHGIGYSDTSWSRSPVAAKVSQVVASRDPQPVVVLSNNPFELWATTGLPQVRWSPRDRGPRRYAADGRTRRIPSVGRLQRRIHRARLVPRAGGTGDRSLGPQSHRLRHSCGVGGRWRGLPGHAIAGSPSE